MTRPAIERRKLATRYFSVQFTESSDELQPSTRKGRASSPISDDVPDLEDEVLPPTGPKGSSKAVLVTPGETPDVMDIDSAEPVRLELDQLESLISDIIERLSATQVAETPEAPAVASGKVSPLRSTKSLDDLPSVSPDPTSWAFCAIYDPLTRQSKTIVRRPPPSNCGN
jgi:hypothetical protein